jgi:hypothetical protein
MMVILAAAAAAAVCLCVQIRGVIYCLGNLGPWCAAAAAYLDLLAPPTTAEEDAAAAEQAAVDAGNVWQGGTEEDECEQQHTLVTNLAQSSLQCTTPHHHGVLEPCQPV